MMNLWGKKKEKCASNLGLYHPAFPHIFILSCESLPLWKPVQMKEIKDHWGENCPKWSSTETLLILKKSATLEYQIQQSILLHSFIQVQDLLYENNNSFLKNHQYIQALMTEILTGLLNDPNKSAYKSPEPSTVYQSFYLNRINVLFILLGVGRCQTVSVNWITVM